MSISPVITRGFGTWGSTSLVITRGYLPGGVTPPPVTSTVGGGVMRHISYLTEAEKKKIDGIVAMLETEIARLPVEIETKADRHKAAKAKATIRKLANQLGEVSQSMAQPAFEIADILARFKLLRAGEVQRAIVKAELEDRERRIRQIQARNARLRRDEELVLLLMF